MNGFSSIVTSEWLADNLIDSRLRIVDVTIHFDIETHDSEKVLISGREDFEKEHIPGAVFALNKKDADIPFTVGNHNNFVKKVTALGIGDDTYTVIYDRGPLVNNDLPSSYWASRLVWQLNLEGFDNVAILDGGLPKWKLEGRPLTSKMIRHPKATFTGKRRTALIVDKDDVLQAIDDEDTVIIDCLSPQQYQGKKNPYGENRSGHIPTSENIFFGNLSDMNSKALHERTELEVLFNEVDALNPNKKVITYCGFGIAATWVRLILNTLGQNKIAVYDGSLNDWNVDKSTPLEQ